MAKTKKITVNAFERVMKETYTPTETFDWNGVEVIVKKTLSLKEMLEFVDTVVKSCFTDTEGVYIPEVKDFILKACVLEKYANFTMPRNLETQYDLIYHTDALERVLGYVNVQQFNEICCAINAKIEHQAQANVEAAHKQMNALFDAFDSLQTQLGGVFAGVGENDVRAVVDALSQGALDEEKLARAYIAVKNESTEPAGEDNG